MSDFHEQAAAELNDRVEGVDIDGTARFAITDVGAIMLDSNGARVGDEEADVTLNADADTFRSIFEGGLNPTSAFMTGKLSVDGDMGLAMKLAAALA